MARKRPTGPRVTRVIWHTLHGTRVEMSGGGPIGVTVKALCHSCTEDELTDIELRIAEIRSELSGGSVA
jgi:hypothetical protein